MLTSMLRTHKGETALYLAVTQSHAEYERMQSEDQNKGKYILNEEFLLEGSSLMVYTLLRRGSPLAQNQIRVKPMYSAPDISRI